MRGSAGDFTFSRNKSRTIVSEKITSTTNRKTAAQQRNRMKWGNIIQMYKGIMPLLECAFENKADGVSDYNMFVKINMQQTPVYLTKAQVSGGACVIAPYTITQGSLPSIEVTASGSNDVTDISLGQLTISASTTVAQFANAVVENNKCYSHGDQISFYMCEQRVNGVTGLPYGVFEAYSVVLDKNDSTTLLLSKVPSEAFTVVNGKLAHAAVTSNCAYAWVHSRKSNDSTKVSSQVLIGHNALLANYTNETAYTAAVNTYGGERNVFLTPSNTAAATSNGGGSTSAAKKTLTLTVSPEGAGTVTGAGQYDAGATANITATAASGYTFTKWSDEDTNATRSITMNSDTTLQAIFTAAGGGDNPGGGGGGTQY